MREHPCTCTGCAQMAQVIASLQDQVSRLQAEIIALTDDKTRLKTLAADIGTLRKREFSGGDIWL